MFFREKRYILKAKSLLYALLPQTPEVITAEGLCVSPKYYLKLRIHAHTHIWRKVVKEGGRDEEKQ